MRKKLCLTLMLSPALLVIGIALACTPKPTPTPTPTVMPTVVTPTPRPTPTAMPTPTATPPSPAPTATREPTATRTLTADVLERISETCEAEGKRGRDRQRGTPYEGLMYMENQVVVSGRLGDIEDTVMLLTGQGITLTLKRGFLLSDERKLEDDRTAIRLYTVQVEGEGDAWVEQVTCIINMLSPFFEYEVAADPNYHLSPAQWAGGESPWTQNGEWTTGIYGGGITLTREITMPITISHESDFQGQWAFGSGGIRLLGQDGNPTVEVAKVEDVRIGIFDSSPFTNQKGELSIPFLDGETPTPTPFPLLENLEPDGGIEPITVTAFTVSFGELMGDGSEGSAGEYLTVWHTVPISAPNCPGGNPQEGDVSPEEEVVDPEDEVNLEEQDLSNHGLFVAGLAHAVAPASKIYLVRVLENDGCANLYSIAESIAGFVQEMEPNPQEPMVINLSLGVHEPPCPRGFGLPPEVTSLQRVISDTIKQDAVVVAAAGNDSYDKASPHEMEIPAREPGVIGVAASNAAGGRGCFSNEGDVAAPGGNGVEREKCRECCEVPSAVDCREHPEYCIVGPIYKYDEGSEPKPGYAYWVGTSFAAPLVSGQAALLLHSGIYAQDVPDRIKKAAESRLEEEDGEIGIIDICRSLP